MQTEPSGPRFAVAVIAGSVAGTLGVGVMPLLLGGFVGLGMTPAVAGSIVTVELLAAGAASLGLADVIARGSRARWAQVGVLVALLGQLASCAFVDPWALSAARCTVGLGQGACLAACSAAAAASRSPERLFGIVAAVQAVVFGVLLAGVALVMEAHGIKGLFVVLAVLSALTYPWLSRLPRGSASSAGSRDASHGAPNRPEAVGSLLGLAVLSVFSMAAWSVSDRIGLRTGLDGPTVGLVLGGSTLAGLLGSAVAVGLGARGGRTLPILAAIAASTITAGSMVVTHDSGVFTWDQLLWGAAYMFGVPYFFGIAAALDAAGRWTAAASGVSIVATALGSVVGGFLLPQPQLFLAALVVAGVLSAVLLYKAARLADSLGSERSPDATHAVVPAPASSDIV